MSRVLTPARVFLLLFISTVLSSLWPMAANADSSPMPFSLEYRSGVPEVGVATIRLTWDSDLPADATIAVLATALAKSSNPLASPKHFSNKAELLAFLADQPQPEIVEVGLNSTVIDIEVPFNTTAFPVDDVLLVHVVLVSVFVFSAESDEPFQIENTIKGFYQRTESSQWTLIDENTFDATKRQILIQAAALAGEEADEGNTYSAWTYFDDGSCACPDGGSN